jgi:hypothetical protein
MLCTYGKHTVFQPYELHAHVCKFKKIMYHCITLRPSKRCYTHAHAFIWISYAIVRIYNTHAPM